MSSLFLRPYALADEDDAAAAQEELARDGFTFLLFRDALVCCDDSNVGSATVIEGCGGVLEGKVVGERGDLTRRYWIGV